AIDLNLPLADTLRPLADALGTPLGALPVPILAPPRPAAVLAALATLGVRVFALPAGAVAASLLPCLPARAVAGLSGLGGAPDGVVSAAVLRALAGALPGRLLARPAVPGARAAPRRLGAPALARCPALGLAAGPAFCLGALARRAPVLFSAPG
ncbi:fructose-bisphosphatase class II, partial [Salmonella enterica subsp. enterica serovar Derby]